MWAQNKGPHIARDVGIKFGTKYWIGLELTNGQEEKTFRSGEGEAAASYDELTSLKENVDYILHSQDNNECRA